MIFLFVFCFTSFNYISITVLNLSYDLLFLFKLKDHLLIRKRVCVFLGVDGGSANQFELLNLINVFLFLHLQHQFISRLRVQVHFCSLQFSKLRIYVAITCLCVKIRQLIRIKFWFVASLASKSKFINNLQQRLTPSSCAFRNTERW